MLIQQIVVTYKLQVLHYVKALPTGIPVWDRLSSPGLKWLRHLIGASVSEPHTSEFYCDFSYIYIYILLLLNVEHCGVSVSKQCTTSALTVM